MKLTMAQVILNLKKTGHRGVITKPMPKKDIGSVTVLDKTPEKTGYGTVSLSGTPQLKLNSNKTISADELRELVQGWLGKDLHEAKKTMTVEQYVAEKQQMLEKVKEMIIKEKRLK